MISAPRTFRNLVVSLAGASLLAGLVAAPSFWALRQTTAAAEARKHTITVIDGVKGLMAGLIDAETGQRGYLLTGDETFLDPYLAVRESLSARLQDLRQTSTLSAATPHFDALPHLIDAKLANLAQNIELRRNNDLPAALANVRSPKGKQLMDSIRAELLGIIQLEEGALALREAAFQSNMRRLFAITVGASLFTLLCAMVFAYSLYQNSRRQFENLVHLKTRDLLEAQEETSARLAQANLTLRLSEEKIAVTLKSIGDAVLVTDAKACVTSLNPVAEQLTGWTQEQALGHPVSEVFHIVNKETRQPATIPVMAALAKGTIQGLANHTVLIGRSVGECDIADSCAPIRDRDGQVVGAVLVFRDVSKGYAVQQELRENEERFRTLADNISQLAWMGDALGSIFWYNQRWFDYTGTTLEVMQGWGWQKVHHPDHELRVVEKFKHCLEMGEVWEDTFPLRGADGQYRWFLSRALPIRNEHGMVVRWFGTNTDITEREEAGALQKAIFDSANFSSIATDAKGVIQIFNVGAERMLGYAAEDVMNKITPADISDPQELIARATALSTELGTPITPGFEALVFKASRGIEDIYELTYIRKDGSRFPAVVSVTALRDEQNTIIGYLLIGTDNTARKQAEEALLKAGALQSAIFNSANFSSIATDAKGVIQIFNVGAERMLGYTATEVMNRITPADISDPHELIVRATALSAELGTPITPGFEALVFKASRGIEDIYELTYIRKDGSRFPAVVSVTALRDAHKEIIGYLLIGTDNTVRQQVEEERKRVDRVLQENTIELEKSKAIAEKANLAKSDFLSSMSHELRSPLNAILGFAQLMDSDLPPPTPSQKDSIDQILHAGWYLLELINEILDLAVVESGRLALSLEPVSLPEVMLECQAMIEPQAQKRGIRMTFPSFANPCYIKADHTRVKQVLINLLSNAIKYNQAGGSVAVDCVLTNPDRVRISVKDTGVGLSPENLTQLFQPFNRLGQEAGGEEGTGIGLVVSKRLVELMRGQIGVTSTVGAGSEFWIELLAENDPHAGYIQAASVMIAESPVASDLRSRLLLYVEDNPANLKLIEQLIARRPDLRLLTAQNGNDGINLARISLPDVILMDINLPGINGIEAMKILRLDPLTAHIPIVALSANAIPRDIEKGLEAGFFRYLTKPIKVDQFMDTLNEVMAFAEDGKSV
jgi:PAS domain S-box-containing protein